MNIVLDIFTQWSNPGAQLLEDGFDVIGGTVDIVGAPGKLARGSNEDNIPITVNMSGGTISGKFFTLGGIPGSANPPILSDGTWNMSGTAMAVFLGNGLIGNPSADTLQSMGTLNMSDDAMLTVDNLVISSTGNGLVNIADNAKIITRGNDTENINGFIGQGYITGQGGR